MTPEGGRKPLIITATNVVRVGTRLYGTWPVLANLTDYARCSLVATPKRVFDLSLGISDYPSTWISKPYSVNRGYLREETSGQRGYSYLLRVIHLGGGPKAAPGHILEK